MLRRIVPAPVKRQVKLIQRALSDLRSGTRGRFAQGDATQSLEHSLSLSQPILNATSEQSRINKIHNIKLAATSIAAIEIKPGEIFSFWRIAGAPTAKNGFKPGINIINGKVIEDTGGGLCQLSGIIYHLSLIGGLTVLERSNHSVDLYHDGERYTPLGADCAVFYGYKDLRLQNDYDHPIRFRFEMIDERLICYLESAKKIAARPISFETLQDDETGTAVATKTSGQIITHSNYEKSAPATSALSSCPSPAPSFREQPLCKANQNA